MLDVITCQHCSARAMLTGDGICPSCRHAPDEQLTPERIHELEVARKTELSPSVKPRLHIRVIAAICLVLAISPTIGAIRILASYQAKTNGVYLAYAAGLLFFPVLLITSGVVLGRRA